jgi:cytochrome c-type biogenesis protein CcmH
MSSRRDFLRRAALGAAASVAGARAARGQQRGPTHDTNIVRDTTNLFAMDQMAARSVTLPPKPGARPSMTDLERDDLEHRLHCQCGCTLDVFTCRTTDFSCQVSPAMHRDVVALVNGGYSAQEIMDAFVGAYGNRVLMAPPKVGFNLLAWITPGIAVVIGGVAVAMWLGRRRRLPVQRAVSTSATRLSVPGVDATPEELARLEAAVKGDDDA